MLDVRADEETVTRATGASAAGRRPEFDYLRAFVIVLVLWHHAILAYATFATVNRLDPVQTFTPVADAQRWAGFDLMAGFNDVFFMPLLFFLSGLFVWRSLGRTGAAGFLQNRLIRLGLPFIVALPILVPLAYYPAQLNVELVFGGDTSYAEFWRRMVGRGFGTAGPLWFLWLLLAFDVLAAIYFRLTSSGRGSTGGPPTTVLTRPLGFAAALLIASMAAYLPMVLVFGPLTWIGTGPFVAQASRVLFYLVYFGAGAVAGAFGLDGTVLASGGALARRWWAWLTAGILLFAVLIVMVVADPPQPIAGALAFTAACAALVLASFAIALRFATRRRALIDGLADNAYGIYIVHYAFVTWLQYGLLSADLSAVTKAVLVFTGTLALSWGLVHGLRRIPAVARVI